MNLEKFLKILGKTMRVLATIFWLIVFVPIAFLITYATPKVDQLLKWVRKPGTTFQQKILRFMVATPIMIIFIPLVFVVSVGSKAIETNFTKHL
jgi:hypothetical protein